MSTFEDLAASRREWIDEVLKPWCRQAPRSGLLKAESEWEDIAGKVDPEVTLWTWAWSRFPDLVHDEMAGVNETREVRVKLANGNSASGYPDGRQSRRGQLVLLGSNERDRADHGPWSIDEIAGVIAL